MKILEELKSLAEESYKEFNRKIIPTEQKTLGIRLPVLRRMARRIVKQDPMAFVRRDKQNIYEMIMLEGMVLSYLDRPFMDLLPHIERFLEKVDNWAQVDSTFCDYKNIRKEKKNVLSVVRTWLASDKEFFVRAGLVILLAHYVEKKNLKTIFRLSQKVAHTGYYVQMGNAWLISVCMAKYPEETLLFFKDNTLDARTHNKAIQKCRESFRVSKENKAILVELKKKPKQ